MEWAILTVVAIVMSHWLALRANLEVTMEIRWLVSKEIF